MRYAWLVALGLLLISGLKAQNRCYAWYDVDTVLSTFGRWDWHGWTRPRVYYVRPGGDYIWLGADSILSLSWWGSCGQGNIAGPRKRVPLYINLASGDSCRLHAVVQGLDWWGSPCTDSLDLLIVAHPGAWGHCYASLSLAGHNLPPGATHTLQRAGHYPATFGARSEWPYTSSYQVRWRLSGPVSLDTTFYSQTLSSPTTLLLPLTQPGVYNLTVGYFIYEQANNGCLDSLRYTIYVLQDSAGWGCPSNFPDTLHLTLGSHTLTFPLGYTTALYQWELTGPSGRQSWAASGDTIRVSISLTSPGWHTLSIYLYSPNGLPCQVYIPIYVSPPTVPPCVSPTVRPCQPLVTINNVTLSPSGGFHTLCSGRNYLLCVSPSGGYCPGRTYSWGYTLYSTGTYTGGPFYSPCDTLRAPANAFSSAFLTVWMTVRDSAGNVVCRDSSFYLLDITPVYCGHPDSVNVGLNDTTYWPGDTIYYNPPDTILGYALPTPISDTVFYTWQWSIAPAGGGPTLLSGISNIIPISLSSPGNYVLQVTSTSQSHQRTRQYSFYIVSRRTGSLSGGAYAVPLLYPNPTSGPFWISVTEGGPYRLEVVDAVGREVLRAELSEARVYGFVLPAGFYLVRLAGPLHYHTYRLVVQP